MNLMSIGSSVCFLGLAYSFIGSTLFIAKQLGWGWAIAAFFLAPATIPIAPIYKWIAMGDPWLFIFSYGLIAVGAAFVFISSKE